MLTYLLAVLAACANATSSVLQRKANREVPRQQNLSLRLIWSLLHEPVWFGGILAVTVGFLLQATALGTGQLSVVEPILVLELPATLILASRVFHSQLGWREWVPTAVMTAGLAGLLYALSPSAGRSTSIRWYDWVIGAGINLALVGVLVAAARRGSAGGRGSGRRAALLGVAGGASFGLTAALMKGMTTTFSAGGFGQLFTSWQLYAMVATGALGMFLVQSALNAGRLLAAQPGLTLSDPVVSILWGVLIFGEQVRGGLWMVLAVLSGVAMSAAVLMLARSPLLSDGSAAGEEEDTAGEPAAGADDTAAEGPAGEAAGSGRRAVKPADAPRGVRAAQAPSGH
jgi:drug/metabolite transporter (DMT)-like permease